MTPEIDRIIEAALKEDIPDGDITSESLIPPESVSRAVFLAKEDGILAGIEVAARVFWKIDPHVDRSREYACANRGPFNIPFEEREDSPQFFAKDVRDRDFDTKICQRFRGNRDKDTGHKEDNSFPASPGKICRKNGRRDKSPAQPLGYGYDQR
jgi:hypothetical protein